jgi:type IV pilus assembly protein PilY1
LTCANVQNCGNYLGATYGTPDIRRLHNGSWAVLFGNGLNSSAGSAGMYVMLVDSTGKVSGFRYLDTGAGISGGLRNGIAYVTPVDLDGDHVVDYAYAGDVLGNVWRFDLTSQDPNSWSVSKLFSTGGKPITSRVAVGSLPISAANGSAPRVVVAFGTGQRFEQTQSSAATYATGQQYLYGIWDWNMSAWNGMAGTGSKYASLSAPQTVTASTLTTQSILDSFTDSSGTQYRTVSTNAVCWAGSKVCGTTTSSNTQFGWVLPLPSGQNEQVIYNPTIAYGMVVVNTIIPPSDATTQALTCNATPPTGFSMAVSMGSGGAGTASFFASAANTFTTYNNHFVSGVGLSAAGTSSFVTTSTGAAYMLASSSGGGGGGAGTPTPPIQVNPFASGIAVGSRLNWTKLR